MMLNLSHDIETAEKQVADSKLDLLYEYHAMRDKAKHVATSPYTIGTAVAGAAAVGFLAYRKKQQEKRARLNPPRRAALPARSPIEMANRAINLVQRAMPLLGTMGVLKAVNPEHNIVVPPAGGGKPLALPAGKGDAKDAGQAVAQVIEDPDKVVDQAKANRAESKAHAYAHAARKNATVSAAAGAAAGGIASGSAPVATADHADYSTGSLLAKTWGMIKEAVGNWVDDYAPSMGAALSYYTLFSLAPMLLIVIAVAGLVFGQDAARGEIVGQLGGLLGTQGAQFVEGLLKSVSVKGHGAIATIIGIVTLLIGATAVFAELQSSLDRIWQVPATKKPSGLWAIIRTRLLSFGMVLGLGFLMLVSLVLSAALAALGKWWGGWFGNMEVLLQLLNFVVSFAVVTGLFAMIYKFMPSAKISWRDVWVGSAVTALLFTVGKFLIGLYIGKSGVASGFGAAGSVVVLLAWVYYSAQIFLLGAEFTWVYSHRFGSRKGEPMPQSEENPTRQTTGANNPRAAMPARA